MTAESAAADARLAAYLGAADDERAREALGELLTESAAPLVAKILRRQLAGRSGPAAADAPELEDLHAEILLKLHLQLAGARAGEREPPASLLDYVAVAAYNAAAGFQMARQPERTRLRDRVRYVLRRETRWSSWTGGDRELLCGASALAGRPVREGLAGRLGELARVETARTGSGWGRFPKLVAAVLEGLGEPCRVEELVDALAAALGIDERPAAPPVHAGAGGESGPDALDGLPDRAPGVQSRLEASERVAAVWAEIELLPDGQRFALLVNLRGEGGEALVEELLATGVVSGPALAASLGLAAAELARLLPELPKDDRWIAERLGLSRQQVINLRKSARLRLARRLRDRLGEPAGGRPGAAAGRPSAPASGRSSGPAG